MYNPYFTGTPRHQTGPPRSPTPDRQEIIRRLKERVTPHRDLQTRDSDMPHAASPPPVLLPSPLFNHTLARPDSHETEWAKTGLAIVRPGSALHKGDFHAKSPPRWQYDGPSESVSHALSTPLATSPVVPWHKDFRGLRSELHDRPTYPAYGARRSTVSYSPSTSFSYQPPTSPLVHQSNAADIPDDDGLQISLPSMQRTESERRYASSPWPYGDYRPALAESYGQRSPIIRDTSIPYKAHQPRLSIGSADYDGIRPLFARTRRTSSSAARTSMVGSFEESILLGRMSSSPSTPVNFTAQIGVLGLGECKPSLKCPPHITVPFPAVFYSYCNSSTKSQPSPYVGLIDLEGRSTPDSAKRKPRSTQIPQGSYRIPAKGQLQVVIKNPHKTAVKLFLIPYDVSTMEPGQKTFIRQRSVLSDGTVVDMPLSALKTTTIDEIMPKPAGRTVMRYMIQLHICCTSKGRIYLHKNIRVVFANRVPDGKEKLRNDIQYPEPRYSPYKPVDPAPELSDEHTSKRRRSEVLPSRTRDALRLSTQQTVFDDRETQSAGALVFDSPVNEVSWLNFSKRDVGKTRDGDGDLGIACPSMSPRSGTESLLVKRLRDMEMRSLADGSG